MPIEQTLRGVYTLYRLSQERWSTPSIECMVKTISKRVLPVIIVYLGTMTTPEPPDRGHKLRTSVLSIVQRLSLPWRYTGRGVEQLVHYREVVHFLDHLLVKVPLSRIVPAEAQVQCTRAYMCPS